MFLKNSGDDLSSQNLAVKVFSALKCFTAEFGMESGSSTSLQPPDEKKQIYVFFRLATSFEVERLLKNLKSNKVF
jgi:hypothetical protein